jgi:N-acetylglucosamine-6-sulfatase
MRNRQPPFGSRISVLKLGMALGCVALPTHAKAQPSTEPRPNIVLILTDDLDSASMQFLPGIAALTSDRGVTFSQFFVSDSLCCPSRTSILCGAYNHNHHVVTNGPPHGGYEHFRELGHEDDTVATWLHDAGYRTVLMGKYLNGYPAGVGPSWVPPGWDEWYVPVDGKPYDERRYVLNENGHSVAYGDDPDAYMVDVLAAKAEAFIKASESSDQPFFMYIAPYAPHFPYTPPPRHADAFDGVRAPRSPSFDEADVSDKPEWVRDLPPLTSKGMADIDLTFRLRLQAMLAVQDLIASVVGALDAAGKLDHTYIFFTSDNGYHFGEHRLMPGKQTPYEEDLRVPLIVRGPGVPFGAIRSHLVGNIDFAPTFLSLAGQPERDDFDGHSFLPLLGSTAPPAESWRRAYLLEHTEEATRRVRTEGSRLYRIPPGLLEPSDPQTFLFRPQSYLPGIPSFEGLRLYDSVYIEYENGERELYDLHSDPWELTNRASTADPALLARLSAALRVLRECAGPGCRAADRASP